MMNAPKIKTLLRNAPRRLARFGLDLTIAGTASIDGPGAPGPFSFLGLKREWREWLVPGMRRVLTASNLR